MGCLIISSNSVLAFSLAVIKVLIFAKVIRETRMVQRKYPNALVKFMAVSTLL